MKTLMAILLAAASTVGKIGLSERITVPNAERLEPVARGLQASLRP